MVGISENDPESILCQKNIKVLDKKEDEGTMKDAEPRMSAPYGQRWDNPRNKVKRHKT